MGEGNKSEEIKADRAGVQERVRELAEVHAERGEGYHKCDLLSETMRV